MTIDRLEVARTRRGWRGARGSRATLVGLVLAVALLGTLALDTAPAHADAIEVSAFTERAEVAHIETRLIFEFRRSTELPIYLPEDH